MELRKWYFAINQSGLPSYERLIRVAVATCRKNTNLQPICLYYGEDVPFLTWLRDNGVTVIKHTSSLIQAIRSTPSTRFWRAETAAGAYLRIDIPLIETEDAFVLYTDVDVMFLSGVVYVGPTPEFFSCAPEHDKENTTYFNSGSMVINVEAMRDIHADFRDFIKTGIGDFYKSGRGTYDQGALNCFFDDRVTPLPLEMNWKPYWGMNENAQILHFHGPKPRELEALIIRDDSVSMPASYKTLYAMNPTSCRHYLDMFKAFESELDRDRATSDRTMKKPFLAPVLSGLTSSVRGCVDKVFIEGTRGTVSGWGFDKTGRPISDFQLEAGGSEISEIVLSRRDRADVAKSIAGAPIQCGYEITFNLDDLQASARDGTELEVWAGKKKLPRSAGFQWLEQKNGGVIARIAAVPNMPLMPQAVTQLILDHMSKSKCYLEYGTGGTTVKASEIGIESVIAVESDADWLNSVRQKISRFPVKRHRMLVHADVGPTRELGYPASDAHWKKYSAYALTAWDIARQHKMEPDLILVDGRFRAACCLASFLFAKPGSRILFDDYLDRPHYHVVEKYVPRTSTVDRMAEFIVPEDARRDDIWLALIATSSDPR